APHRSGPEAARPAPRRYEGGAAKAKGKGAASASARPWTPRLDSPPAAPRPDRPPKGPKPKPSKKRKSNG
ncbi:MAG TPA: hypothetical protein VIJ94_16755, partial [Caulobacteraceae bacterium]